MTSEPKFRKRRVKPIDSTVASVGIAYGYNGEPNRVSATFGETMPEGEFANRRIQGHFFDPAEALDFAVRLLTMARTAAPGLDIPHDTVNHLRGLARRAGQ